MPQPLKTWLTGASPGGPTIGGFLYVTIASVAAGMTCSAIRFHIIDRIHAWTGITHPAWDFSKLADRVAAYDTLIEIHYNYYKFHANGLVALVIFYIARQSALRHWSVGVEDVAFLLLGIVFFATSRDNLRRYYTRVAKLLGTEIAATHDVSEQQLAAKRRKLHLCKNRIEPSVDDATLTDERFEFQSVLNGDRTMHRGG